jgi:hypothetical protein
MTDDEMDRWRFRIDVFIHDARNGETAGCAVDEADPEAG